MRLLHLCLDEKFIPFAQKVYEAAYPGANAWYVYVPEGGADVSRDMHPVDDAWLRSDAARLAVNAADGIIVHYLDPAFYDFVASLSDDKLVVWHGWGEDIYPFLTAWERSPYLRQTRSLVIRLRAAQFLEPLALGAKLIRKWRRRRDRGGMYAVLAKFDYISMARAEFEILRQSWPGLRATFREFHYNSVEEVFARGPDRMSGDDILLGNSASASNNHLDAIDLLSRFDLAGRKVYCPLSYGGRRYADAIERAGRRRLGDAFVPLREFLGIDEYYGIVGSCGTVVMNHVRQQAVGSIGTALYKGAAVYLRPENTVLEFFRDMGAVVFEMDGLDPARRLGADEVERNRRALEACYGFEKVVACVKGYAWSMPAED